MLKELIIALSALGAFGLIFTGIAVVLSKKTQGGFIATLTLGILCLISVVGVLIWFASVRTESKKYNLTTIELTDLPEKQSAVEDGFVQLTDLKMHYVKYGTKGHDVILIHGNGGNCDSLKGLAEYLANDYVVYCVDDRCQGKSEDPGVITYELMAKDIYEFIGVKGLNKPYIMGHSDGGMVGIALAANYPESVGALVSCGANSKPSAFRFYFTFGVSWNNFWHPDKLNDLMLTEPNFTVEYLARITAPTYIVAGEFDIMPLSDSVYIHNSIRNSEIAIIKWGSHGSYFGANCEYIYSLTKGFFEKHAV